MPIYMKFDRKTLTTFWIWRQKNLNLAPKNTSREFRGLTLSLKKIKANFDVNLYEIWPKNFYHILNLPPKKVKFGVKKYITRISGINLIPKNNYSQLWCQFTWSLTKKTFTTFWICRQKNLNLAPQKNKFFYQLKFIGCINLITTIE